VIEGLRVSPWLHEALRRKNSIEYLSDCTTCKTMKDKQERQAIGCGWERPDELAPVLTWSPTSLPGNSGWQIANDPLNPDPTTCPGYSCSLPEVMEVARARVHWKEGGGLRDFSDEPITDHLRVGVEILEGATQQMQRWATENPESKER
jgi:hypothetical protein